MNDLLSHRAPPEPPRPCATNFESIALLLQGGGPDRVVVVDGRTNQVLQRVRLAR